MDGGGRFARTLKGPVRKTGSARARQTSPQQASFQYSSGPSAYHVPGEGRAPVPRAAAARAAKLEMAARHPFARLIHAVERRLPRGAGVTATALVLAGALVLGIVRGGHIDTFLEGLRDTRDALANAAGFGVATLSINGRKHMSQDEILAVAGITGKRSLLFLDAADIRSRLKASPWITEANVLKLYPDRLQIDITERAAFALWQRGGHVAVIAEDGAVLEDQVARSFTRLPLVVGAGAAPRAREFLALVNRFPALRANVQAVVLVGERRWNLHMTNGIDIRLPEYDVERALQTLARLNEEKQLLTRDITAVDLRLPDRVTVRLSEEAFEARGGTLKDKKPKRKAGDA